jgi:TonB family protein
MIKITKLAAAAAVIVTSCTAIHAKPKEPIKLAPSSKWHVEYAESTCTLARDFGESDDKVTVLFDRMEPSDTFSMTIFGNRMKVSESDSGAKIEFGPGGGEQTLFFFNGTTDKGQPALIFQGGSRIRPLTKDEEARQAKAYKNNGFVQLPIAPITEADEMAVTELKIGRPFRQPLALQTGSMGKAFRALRDCTDNLVRYWGYDPAKRLTMQRVVTPTTSPGEWITGFDYPVSELSRGGRGIVHFRMDVDATGKATNCEVLKSASSPEFKRAVCLNMMKHARFQPAIDATGNPIPWYWKHTVTFTVPGSFYPIKKDFRTG